MEHPEFVRKLIRITSAREWNDLARQVKRENGGQYPDWWFPKIIQSGFADQILAEFGASTKITVSTET